MQALFLVLHVLVGIGLITLILLQHGKGADAGAAFGSGASATVFGARGSATFLTKATAVLALLFFSNSFFLNYLSANTTGPKSIIEEQKEDNSPTGIIESTVTPRARAAGRAAAVRSPGPPRRSRVGVLREAMCRPPRCRRRRDRRGLIHHCLKHQRLNHQRRNHQRLNQDQPHRTSRPPPRILRRTPRRREKARPEPRRNR